MSDIHRGKYRPGDRIESVRAISERHGFQRGIGLYALARLAAEGFLYSEPKRGFYVNPDLDARRYYAIGYFLSDSDPMCSGISISAVNSTALRHGYRAVFGCNFQQDTGVEDFLRANKQLDGLVLDGKICEKILDSVKRAHLPYMVLGNYDISPEHPQKVVDVAAHYYRALLPELEKFRGQRVAAFVGDQSFQSDRDSKRGLLRALTESGVIWREDDIVECSDTADRFAECRRLVEDREIAAICIWGGPVNLYRKYMRIAKPGRRPVVIFGAFPFRPGDAELFDRPVEIPLLERNLIVEATEELFQAIERNLAPKERGE